MQEIIDEFDNNFPAIGRKYILSDYSRELKDFLRSACKRVADEMMSECLKEENTGHEEGCECKWCVASYEYNKDMASLRIKIMVWLKENF